MAGKKGASGRRSLREEATHLEWLESIFYGDPKTKVVDVKKLKKKVSSGKYNASDVAALKMLVEGNERLLSQALNKLISDKHTVQGMGDDGEIIVGIKTYDIKEITKAGLSSIVKKKIEE